MNADLRGSTLALWEIVSVVVSCLIAEWVVLAFVGANKVLLAIPIALALIGFAVGWYWIYRIVKDVEDN